MAAGRLDAGWCAPGREGRQEDEEEGGRQDHHEARQGCVRRRRRPRPRQLRQLPQPRRWTRRRARWRRWAQEWGAVRSAETSLCLACLEVQTFARLCPEHQAWHGKPARGVLPSRLASSGSTSARRHFGLVAHWPASLSAGVAVLEPRLARGSANVLYDHDPSPAKRLHSLLTECAQFSRARDLWAPLDLPLFTGWLLCSARCMKAW